MKLTQGKLDASLVNTLMTDLYMNWDKEYSAKNFPPAKNFFGKIDRDNNHHILSDQIHQVPKITNFVAGFCVFVQHNIHDELPSYQSRGVIVKYFECTQVPKVSMTQADVKIFLVWVMQE